MYKTPTTNIMVTKERRNISHLRLETRQEEFSCPPILFNIVLEYVASTIEEENEIHQERRNEVITLFSNCMFIYKFP
jgi:hypothetical protein